MPRFIIAITLVCVAAFLVPGVTYPAARPFFAQHQGKEKEELLKKVSPGADEYRKNSMDEKEYYECYRNGKIIGYVIYTVGNGYSGDINMLVGIDNDAKITGIEVLSHKENPGMGARCVEVRPKEKEPWFLAQFKGKPASELNRKTIDAITGATITTEAVIKAVKEQAAAFLGKVKRG